MDLAVVPLTPSPAGVPYKMICSSIRLGGCAKHLDDGMDCNDEARMMGGSFMVLMMQRYPCAQADAYCTDAINDSNWMRT